MPIKNNVKPDEYGSSVKKPLSVDLAKSNAFGSVQKLSKKGMNLKTPFFLHTKYYEGGEPFLAIGESSGLLKKFKKEKMSDDVAYGNFYLVKEGNSEVVCFEYISGQGKFKKETEWAKVFKIVKKWLKRECKVILVSEEEVSPTTSSKTSTVEQESVTKGVVSEQVREMANNYKQFVVGYKQVSSTQNDPQNITILYKRILKWQKILGRLPQSDQTQLASTAQKVEELKGAIAILIKREKLLNNEIDNVIPLIADYQTDFDEGKKSKILKAIKTVDKIATALNDYEILEQTEELKDLLSNELIG
ncbi:MAG: hypothetical protein AB8E82_07215 [Aureispira sp.]